MPCWIAVHLPALPIEALAATVGHDQAHRPLALQDGALITAVDVRAWEAGVRPGQRRATALALEPSLLLGRAHAERERQALRAVAFAALQFTPYVTEQAPHTVLLEVAASQRLFGGLALLARRLCDALAPLRHRIHLACAPTAWGAALLARGAGSEPKPADAGQETPNPLQTPLGQASRLGRGLGPHAPSLKTLRAALDPLPLALLCAHASEQETLQGMGLQRVGDLRALPRQGLARRFGPELLRRLDQACGEAPDPREWVSLPAVFEARLELFARADSTEQVLHGADMLLTRLVHWAQARQARVSGFTLEMAHEHRHRGDDIPDRSRLPIALAQPCADVAHLRGLLRERLARTPLPAPTLELHLRCDQLAFAAPPDGELFPTRARAQEGLARLVEHLQARLGADRVHALASVADHRPERGAGHRVPSRSPEVPHPTGPSTQPGWATGLPHLTRPAWLLPQPRPLPERQGRPMLEGQPLRLLAGPERIEAGWWDGPAVARDYFIAGTPAGVLVWIYRTRLPQAPAQAESGWVLQGWFG
ncbi:MAG: DNA polymerase Y family protein [Rubrivivax sp.]|nr:DNA polymerase Y family protein [Rubrivivax sp.]